MTKTRPNTSSLFFWYICWSFSLVHFKNLTREVAQMFIPSMRFQQYSLVSSSFLILLWYSFYFFLSSSLVWLCPLPLSPVFLSFLFSGILICSWFDTSIIIYFCVYWLIKEFFTPVSTDGFQLESECQQVFPSLQDSSYYFFWLITSLL